MTGPAEFELLEELKRHLVGKYGLSDEDGHIFLRSAGGSIHLMVVATYPASMMPIECFLCGGADQLMPAKMIIVQANDGRRVDREVMTCTWCRSPQ